MSIRENRKIMVDAYLAENDLELLDIISKCIDEDDFETFCSLHLSTKRDVFLTIGMLMEDYVI